MKPRREGGGPGVWSRVEVMGCNNNHASIVNESFHICPPLFTILLCYDNDHTTSNGTIDANASQFVQLLINPVATRYATCAVSPDSDNVYRERDR